MSELSETVPHNAAFRGGNGGKLEFASCRSQLKNDMTPMGLVVSSDDQVRQRLGEILGQSGLGAVFASTVTESALLLSACNIFVVLCEDHITDGKYGDVVEMATQGLTQVPVIVVSRTGDWPQYLTAVHAGAFDYVAYPLIPGDLQRAIQNALWECGSH